VSENSAARAQFVSGAYAIVAKSRREKLSKRDRASLVVAKGSGRFLVPHRYARDTREMSCL
jgi:hypothetical protein